MKILLFAVCGIIVTSEACGPPEAVENAELQGGSNRTQWQNGDTVTYTCSKEGMVMRGYNHRTCNNDTWTKPGFECVWRTCNYLDHPSNGRSLNFNNKPTEITEFECNEGYIMRGHRRLVCMVGGHWRPEEPPTCHPVMCPDPDDIAHGSKFRIVDDYGSVVFYTCDKNYQLVGQTRRRCMANGQWDGVDPACVPSTCPKIELENGSVEYSGLPITLYTYAVISCGEYADIDPPDAKYVVCLDDKTWSKTAHCRRQAKITTLNNGLIQRTSDSGWLLVENGTRLRHGTEIRQSCFGNYELYRDGYLNANFTKSTNNNGRWEPRMASCKEIPSIANGAPKLGDGSTARGKVEHGATVITVCNAKFELGPSSETRKMCLYGQLQLEDCVGKKCHVTNIPGVETLDIFNNGVKLSIGMTVENRENVSVKCRPEFDPDIDYEDPYVMTCDHGDWSKELTCTSRNCDIPDIPNAEDSEVMYNVGGGGGAKHGEQIEVVCKEGYELSDGTDRTNVTCKFGNWTSLPLECLERQAKITTSNKERIERRSGSGWIIVENGTRLRHGTEIRQSCFRFYELYRDGYLNAYYTKSTNNNGRWEPRMASCKGKRCDVPSIANGAPKLSDGSTARGKVEHGVTVTTVCNAKFELGSTNETRTMCWNGQLPLNDCVEKKCHAANIPGFETLDIFYNGVKLSIGMTVENQENVSVKCRPGFDPDIDNEDPYVMNCDHGDWSKELTCTPKKCHTTNIPSFELLDIFYNGVRLSVGMNVESSEKVSVKCRPGFDPDIEYEDSYVMSCDHGNWSNGLICTPKRCEVPSIANGTPKLGDGSTAKGKVDHGATVTTVCNAKFELGPTSEASKRCSYGQLQLNDCVGKKCHVANMPGVETLDIFNNGVKLSIGMTVENRENASVKCRPKFDPDIDYEDPYVMTCDHGDWSKELTCAPKKCHTTNIYGVESLDIFYNGVQLSVGMNVESSEKVSVKCRPGFDPDPSIEYEGSFVMSCDHGYWSNWPTCTPRNCDIPDIPNAEKSEVMYIAEGGVGVKHDEKIELVCQKGYELSDGTGRTNVTCKFGNWTSLPSGCHETVDHSGPVIIALVAGASALGVAVILLVWCYARRRAQKGKKLTPADSSLESRPTGLRANDYSEISQTLPGANSRAGLHTELKHHAYENVDIEEPGVNVHDDGPQTEGQINLYVNIDTDLSRTGCDMRKGSRTERQTNTYVDMDIDLSRAGCDMRKGSQKERQTNTYVNIDTDFSRAGCDMRKGPRTERQTNTYVDMDTVSPRAVDDIRKGSQTEWKTNTHVNMDTELPRAGGDRRKGSQPDRPLISRDKRRDNEPMYINTKI